MICPVKDESWILDKFLAAVSLFADHIVVLDHNSSDSSREIAARFPKVDLIEYSTDDFDENARRRLLLERARRFGTGNVIFALDADEFLTLGILSSEIQEIIHAASEGTRFRVPLANLRPGLEEFWAEKMDAVALVDDGSNFDHNSEIHFPRLPVGNKSKTVGLPNVFLMHLQYVDWNRMLSKRRWYMAWEGINYPRKSPLRIIRRYSHMNVIHSSQGSPIPESWLTDYKARGIDLRELSSSGSRYRWDSLVRDWVIGDQVKNWHLLLSAEERKELGLRTSVDQDNQILRHSRYLNLTSYIYERRRFFLWRVVLRLLDELAYRTYLR